MTRRGLFARLFAAVGAALVPWKAKATPRVFFDGKMLPHWEVYTDQYFIWRSDKALPHLENYTYQYFIWRGDNGDKA